MVAFLSYDIVLEFSRLRSNHIFKATRFLHTERQESAREYSEGSIETGVLFCGGLIWILLWNISVARIRWLID